MKHKIMEYDPSLGKYRADFDMRLENYRQKKAELLKNAKNLSEFANGHKYFGFHKTENGWFYREWAPAAEKMYLTGDFCGWDRYACPMEKKDNGVFEIFLPGVDALKHGQKVMAVVVHNGQELDRIPLYARRVVQDPVTFAWNAEIYDPETPFAWKDSRFRMPKDLFIYECHIGMAQEDGKVGTYIEFKDNVLPRIKALGYNTIQIMAVMEHPYYASFGYQVTNLFAASSRFGQPDELKAMINAAHKMGIAVLLDVVHSHACINTREGINEFDGTPYQFFHDGPRGNHSAWGTKCFDYGKNEVIHFLLSNLKFWMEEYHFDGFRFDGVTSMLYLDHGLGTSFTNSDQYFSMNVDIEALTYLRLANEMIRQIKRKAVTIAEETSAMPGLALPLKDGGTGFDYRLAMGVPDMWIRLLKDWRDEDWNLNDVYYELTIRRSHEKVIGYCESHDQALVGDKTIMFRLCDQEMYWGMGKDQNSIVIDRGMALHKIIRLLTMSLGGEGYLTFMGNEFGHPEWIDFPREGNGWSYHYCRRQWSLVDNADTKYPWLNAFEVDMVAMAKRCGILSGKQNRLMMDPDDRTLAYEKGSTLFAFNLDPQRCYDGYFIPTNAEGMYRVSMSTDDYCYGGSGRVYHQQYEAKRHPDGRMGFQIYLPNRTGIVLEKV